MAIGINDGFMVGSNIHIDNRDSFSSISEMKNYPEDLIPEGKITYVGIDSETGEFIDNYYSFNSSNPETAELGKWKHLATGNEVEVITYADYLLLSEEEKNNNKIRIVTDFPTNGRNITTSYNPSIQNALVMEQITLENIVKNEEIALALLYDVNSYIFTVQCLIPSGQRYKLYKETNYEVYSDTSKIYIVFTEDLSEVRVNVSYVTKK